MFGNTLEIAALDQPAYFLGYRMGGPTALHVAGDGFLATDNAGLVELDAHFHTRKIHELAHPQGGVQAWSGVRIVDGQHAVATTYINGAHAIYLIELGANEAKLVTSDGALVDYQLSSGILGYRAGNTFKLIAVDVKTGTIGTPVAIPFDPQQSMQLVLLDAVRAKGAVAAIVTGTSTSATIKLIGALHPERANDPYDIVSEKTVELGQRWWDTVGDLTKLVDRSMVPSERIKSPDGKHAAEVRKARIRLFDAKGGTVWVVPAHAATNVVWTPSGRLVAFGAGIAELDLATGALLERQCGWRFGKWITEPEGFGPSQLCDAP